MTEPAPLSPVLERWVRVLWRASQHMDMMRRQMIASHVKHFYTSGKPPPKINELQAACPHPRNHQRRGGNRYGRYVHCLRCSLRLSFTPAAAVKDPPVASKAKPGLPNPKASPSPSPKAMPEETRPGSSSDVSPLLEMQREQSRLLTEGFQMMLNQQKMMMDQQARLTGQMVESVDRLQHVIVAASGSAVGPVHAPQPSGPGHASQPTVAPAAAAHQIPVPVMVLDPMTEIVDLTVGDEMDDLDAWS
jgi:hypothetical protein